MASLEQEAQLQSALASQEQMDGKAAKYIADSVMLARYIQQRNEFSELAKALKKTEYKDLVTKDLTDLAPTSRKPKKPKSSTGPVKLKKKKKPKGKSKSKKGKKKD